MKKWQVCVCGVLKDNNKILLIKRSLQDEKMPGVWEMPSGKLEFGELLEEGLNREVFEETGIDISGEERKIIGISEYKSENLDNVKYSVQINYLIEVNNCIVKLSDEHIDYDWVGINDERIDEFLSDIIYNIPELKNNNKVRRIKL